MAGEKMTAGQAAAARKTGKMTALKRQNAEGAVKAYAGKKQEDKATQESVNAAKIKAEADRAEAARKAGAAAAKKKKLSAAEIAMGMR